MRRIATVLVDRANYGRLKPLMEEIARSPHLDQYVIAAGSMVLERFGRPVDLVRKDGFGVHEELYCSVEGSTPTTMARSVGFAVEAFAGAFARLKPDIVLLIGDRCEALGAAIAAAYGNRCIVHLQGGELSGSLDEPARHAISMFAHYHVPATRGAAARLIRLGQDADTILAVGCPSADLAARITPPAERDGSVLVAFHPVTTEHEEACRQAWHLITAISWLNLETLVLWPNIDAGADGVSKAYRRFRDRRTDAPHIRFVKNLPPEEYLQKLATVSLCVGNSSSFVRDAGYFGTPVVLIGSRQAGRERANNVYPPRVMGEASPSACYDLCEAALRHGPFTPSALYGRPGISAEICRRLETLSPYRQKVLHEDPGDCPGARWIQGHPAEEPATVCGPPADRLDDPGCG